MYRPRHFRSDDRAQGYALIDALGFGQLIGLVDGTLCATPMPFVRQGDHLLGHLARANPLARAIGESDLLVTFSGPHGYISPSWYRDPGVPTWNYIAVQVAGRAQRVDDPAAVHALLQGLTEEYERQLPTPWVPDYDPRQLNAIVAFSLPLAGMAVKLKLSQNRSEADRAGVIEGLNAAGNGELAGWVANPLGAPGD